LLIYYSVSIKTSHQEAFTYGSPSVTVRWCYNVGIIGALDIMTLTNISRKKSIFGNNNFALFVLLAVAFALATDTFFAKQFLFSQNATNESVTNYTIISMVCIVGQYLILVFVRYKSQDVLRKTRRLRLTYRSVVIGQNVVVMLFVILLLQVHLARSYNSSIAISASLIAYSLAFAVILYLAQLFFSWFKVNRHKAVLLYALSSASICVNLAITLVLIGIWLPVLPTEIYSTAAWFRPNLVPGSLAMTFFFNTAYLVSTIVSFIITWIATAILLRHYSKKIGKILYWFVMSMPLIYFLSQFLSLVGDQILPLGDPVGSIILLTLLFSLSRPIGGAVFGVAFLDASRKIKDETVRGYMLTSAFGFTLFFISSQIVGTAMPISPFPPFGFPAVLFTGLSSLLILVGIYSSAVSVSHDLKLRQTMRRAATNEAKLVESIGWAQMENEIVERVMAATKENPDILTQETGIRPSLKEADLKEYLEHVLNELKAEKEKKESRR
jgi:hypothetical protein